MNKNDTKPGQNANASTRINALKNAGAKHLNPQGRFYRFERAEPLECWIQAARQARSKDGKLKTNFQVIVLYSSRNGIGVNPKTGEILDEPPFHVGEMVIVGESKALEGLNAFVQGDEAVVIHPIEKVRTNGGQTFWRVDLYARPLTDQDRAVVASHPAS